MRDATTLGTVDLVDRFMTALRGLTPLGVRNGLELLELDRRFDARLRWTVADRSVLLDIEVKVQSVSRLDLFDRATEDEVPVLVAPFLARGAREQLEAAGWSYWDATGNLLLCSRDPLILIRREGATKDPDPDVLRPPARLRSLKGQAASEVVVGLLANQGRAGAVRDFARDRQLPPATVSRVFTLLREENLLEPTGGGPIVVRDRLALARRWAEDYSYAKTFTARRYYSLLGQQQALQRIRQSGLQFAVTGLQPAQAWLEATPGATLPSTEMWLYVDDVTAIERVADLAPAPRDGSILVAHADFLARETGWTQADGTPSVTPWRTVGDLLSRPGRTAAIGEALAEALIGQPTTQQATYA